MTQCIVMQRQDNIATVLDEVTPGDRLQVKDADGTETGTLVALEKISFAHKIAVAPIANGEALYKYGQIIGRATADIVQGGYVHVHNVKSIKGSMT